MLWVCGWVVYSALTYLSGRVTFGEEYCDLVSGDVWGRKLSVWVFWMWFVIDVFGEEIVCELWGCVV